MDIQVEEIGTCKKKITVTVPKEKIDEEFNENLDELIPKAQLPGFRVGHAPRRLVEKRFKDRIMEEVKEKLVADSYRKAIQDNNLEPIGEPDIGEVAFDPETSLHYDLTVEVKPTFEISDYKGLELEKPALFVTDTEVESAVKRFLINFGTIQSVDDESPKENDIVIMDVAFQQDGEEFHKEEGMQLSVSKEIKDVFGIKDMDLVKLLDGMKAKDTKELDVTFPDDFFKEEYRGKEGKIVITLNEVKRRIIPELDDELLKKVGVQSEDELKDRIKQQITIQKENNIQQRLREDLFDKLLEKTDFELPEDIVSKGAEDLKKRKEMELRMMGISPEKIKEKEEEIASSSKEDTIRDYKIHFILEKIAKDEKVFATEDDVAKAVANLAAQNNTTPERILAQLQKNDGMSSLRMRVREDKTVQLLLDKATITEKQPEEKDTSAKKKDEGKTQGDKKSGKTKKSKSSKKTDTKKETDNK